MCLTEGCGELMVQWYFLYFDNFTAAKSLHLLYSDLELGCMTKIKQYVKVM